MLKFVNEEGNEISLSVTEDNGDIRVWALGPHTEVDHVWTHNEAMVLYMLLGEVLQRPKNPKNIIKPEGGLSK